MNDERRAIEALRAGVPNRAAIRLLGTNETAIRDRFVANLERCQAALTESRPIDGQPLDDQPVTGQVIAGAFGAGKSHLLGYLQELALERNFIVSWVAISKETPLFDRGKLYLSALRNAVVPGRNDDAVTAVLTQLPRPQSKAYDDLAQWAEGPESGLSPLFAGLLYLLPNAQTDRERIQQIARFLAGGKPNLANFRQWLREAGAVRRFPFKAIKQAELVRQRLHFLPRLIAAAGFSGWVLLLDEVELIGRYSVLQRGRSYAELARWLGLDQNYAVAGVHATAAITNDFTDEVILRRRDDEQAPLKLANKNEPGNAAHARLGIAALNQQQSLLHPPDTALLQASLAKISALYAKAYDWEVPATPLGAITATRSMRQYIKAWITAWDLARLYGTQAEIETLDLSSNYEESTDLETAEPDGAGDDD